MRLRDGLRVGLRVVWCEGPGGGEPGGGGGGAAGAAGAGGGPEV